VAEWATDGTTRVNYRGSGWPARLAKDAAATVGEHEIVAVEGNWLVLAPRRPAG
jgi:membrane protein implicated in regulation of membrane protease activity